MTQFKVELYIYDLSHGMARNLSQALTGRMIEAIYHTSIVWNNSLEVFYGQGISTALPGQTHHGQPLEKYQLGDTSIDEETLNALLESLREKYTPQAYHLLDFNCNNFTEELSQILTGNSIPGRISSLPADFLSTPFGQMLRPQIDAMFRPSSQPALPRASLNSDRLANGLLGQVANQAFSNSVSTSLPQSPLQIVSNNSQIDSLIRDYPSVAILYTSETCPPCKVVQPVFSELAEKHSSGSKKIAFGRVDSSPATSPIMSARGITATPTVQIWTRGSVKEVKGADIGEIKTQIELSLFESYPPHPHSKLLELKSVSLVPSSPILVTAVPNLRGLLTKLDTFISSASTSNFNEKADLQDARKTISSIFISALETRFNNSGNTSSSISFSSEDLQKISQAMEIFLKLLPSTSLFPILDLIRLSALDKKTGESFSKIKIGEESFLPTIINQINTKLTKAANEGESMTTFKATLITSLKLLSNVIASTSLRSNFLGSGTATSDATALIVSGLLSEDKMVRAASATTAFNAVLHAGEGRKDWLDQDQNDVEPEWEAEITSALIESIKQERESDETVHRLLASLFHLLHLSTAWLDHLQPLLEVLEASDVLQDCLDSEIVKGSKKEKELKTLLMDCKVLCEAAT